MLKLNPLSLFWRVRQSDLTDYIALCKPYLVCVSVQDVNHYKGKNYPIMNLQERVLSVLACRVRERERERESTLLPSSCAGHDKSWGRAGARHQCCVISLFRVYLYITARQISPAHQHLKLSKSEHNQKAHAFDNAELS